MSMLKLIFQNKCFDGMQYIYSHESTVTNCIMRFGIFLPPHVSDKSPTLYWLSGLTCTEENFIIKSGAQRIASELGIILIAPDTSPRGLNIPGENENYDLGLGAGYYMDAIIQPWSEGYRMYSYITDELPTLLSTHFPIDTNRVGIFGHSMGGHGALMIALRNPDKYKTVSAFAPISSIMHSTWGQKALKNYLGQDKSLWQNYDIPSLISTLGWQGPTILIDQGSADKFLQQELKPDLLKAACEKKKVKLNLRLQEDYDHSYFFIMSFIEDHLRFHYSNLQSPIN
jgi:S-formylglutathione hydrolase